MSNPLCETSCDWSGWPAHGLLGVSPQAVGSFSASVASACSAVKFFASAATLAMSGASPDDAAQPVSIVWCQRLLSRQAEALERGGEGGVGGREEGHLRGQRIGILSAYIAGDACRFSTL